ncbi:NAD-dependent epimerase/dehydratase family protein [Plesiomonas shigelloides]|uniref:NAD-dependent epimerase/dehydratase family protein n=1 Tax=Plesiomonas shigelloides TaxID=703 RepID=UPI0022484FE7|nr:NAD-dependent epimerase/dehydratase family protein [Plesiomonas shigelloides]MCX2532818.1 NAD-dependent epimerase/dehydratase family protein [Plesiomonas shigelloides]
MKLLVTGSSGFIGSAFVELAESRGDSCIKQRRSSSDSSDSSIFFADLSSSTDWSLALRNIECVVHCAAVVHQMKGVSEIEIYRRANTDGTISLARQAAAAGVKRFVFVSSIKVNGEKTESGSAFKSDVLIAPSDPYGLSKFEAEQHLRLLSLETGMEVVIIRPPLVYGPGVKANFRTMMNWVSKGLPLPFSHIGNKRSLVFLQNLVDLLWLCTRHPNAPGNTFLVSDDHDVSTSELLHGIAVAMNKTVMLFYVPRRLIDGIASLLGKRNILDRLFGNLQVDINDTKRILDWVPPYSMEQGLATTVKAFLTKSRIE